MPPSPYLTTSWALSRHFTLKILKGIPRFLTELALIMLSIILFLKSTFYFPWRVVTFGEMIRSRGG